MRKHLTMKKYLITSLIGLLSGVLGAFIMIHSFQDSFQLGMEQPAQLTHPGVAQVQRGKQ